jgi:hypothetical protein
MTYAADRKVLESVVGSKISHAEALVYSFNNLSANVIALRVGFSTNQAIIIDCASDGESLRVSQGILEECDLDEFGQLKVIDADSSDLSPISGCVNQIIDQLTLQLDSNKLMSIKMKIGRKTVFVSNVGDELNFDEARFQEMLVSEGWGILTTITYPAQ